MLYVADCYVDEIFSSPEKFNFNKNELKVQFSNFKLLN